MRKFLSRLCSNVIFPILFDHGPVIMRVVTSQIAIKIYGFEILVPPLEDPKKIFLFQIFFFIYSEVHLIQM